MLSFNSLNQNSIAGAASILEVLQQEADSESAFTRKGALDLCSQALAHLYQTMEWCAERSLMLDLAQGKYVSKLSRCRVRDLFSSVTVQGNHHYEFAQGGRELTDTLCEGSFDVQMARLALVNAVSNANAHGDGGTITLRVSYTDHFVVFSVENKVPKGTFVTDASLKLLRDASLSGVSPPEDAKIMRGSANLRSTRSGLRHIALVCGGIGSSFDLYTKDEGSSSKVVVIEFFFPCCKDEGNLLNAEQGESKTIPGDENKPCFPDSLTISAIDDSKLICKGYERVLFKKLQADASTSIVCCPTSQNAVQAYVDRVCGLIGDASDILIIDQNIDLTEETSIAYGTEIAKEIRGRSFDGLIALRTANDSAQEVEKYLSEGSIDICLGKSDSHDVVAEQIKQAYVKKIRSISNESALRSKTSKVETSIQA